MAEVADGPKKHSPFMQVVFRKSGESLDLAGKALLALSGAGSLLQAHGAPALDWRRVALGLIVGSGFVAVGIYLQAKAEET